MAGIEVKKQGLSLLKAETLESSEASSRDIVLPKKSQNSAQEQTKDQKLEKLVTTLEELRYKRGLYLQEGQRADGRSERKMGLSLANERIKYTENQIENLVEGDKAQLERIYQRAGEKEVAGLTKASEEKLEKREAEARQVELERKSGGAKYALKEIWKNAGEAAKRIFPSSKESAEMIGKTALAEAKTLFTTGSFEKAAKAGGVALEQVRLRNLNERGESILGKTEDFAHGKNTVLGNAVTSVGVVLSPLEKAAKASISPVVESLDVGRIAAQTVSYNSFAGKEGKITYNQYQELEQTEGMLRAAKVSFKVGELAAGAAVLGPATAGELLRPLAVSGLMGSGSALSQELLSDEGFKFDRWAENSVVGTADSMLFMGAMKPLSQGYVYGRTWGTSKFSQNVNFDVLSKVSKGVDLTAQEAKFMSRVMKEARFVTGSIDLVDSQSDLKGSFDTLGSVDENDPRYARKLLGALLGVGIALEDGFDVSHGARSLIERGSRSNQSVSEVSRTTHPTFIKETTSGEVRYFDSLEDLQKAYVEKIKDEYGPLSEEQLADLSMQAEKISGFYDRNIDENGKSDVYVVTPQTLVEKQIARETRILEASIIIHENAHREFEKKNPVVTAEDEALQEISALGAQAAYLAKRGFRLYFKDGETLTIEQVKSFEQIRNLERQITSLRKQIDENSSDQIDALKHLEHLTLSLTPLHDDLETIRDVVMRSQKQNPFPRFAYFDFILDSNEYTQSHSKDLEAVIGSEPFKNFLRTEGINENEVIKIEFLGKGAFNAVYKVTAGDNVYALRLNRIFRKDFNVSALIEKENILFNKLKDSGVSAEIFLAHEDFAVMEFLDGSPITSQFIQSRENIKKIIDKIKIIHAIDISDCRKKIPEYDPFVELNKLFFKIRFDPLHALLAEQAFRIQNDISERYEAVVEAVPEIYTNLLIHNDIAKRNILNVHDEVKIIDFDKVRIGSPLVDLANVSGLKELRHERDFILREYYGYSNPSLEAMLEVYEDFELLRLFYAFYVSGDLKIAEKCLILLQNKIDKVEDTQSSVGSPPSPLAQIPCSIDYIGKAIKANNFTFDTHFVGWLVKLLLNAPGTDADVIKSAAERSVAALSKNPTQVENFMSELKAFLAFKEDATFVVNSKDYENK